MRLVADLKGLEEEKIQQRRIVDGDGSGGLEKAEAGEGGAEGEEPERGVGEEVEWPGETDTIEAQSDYSPGDGVERLLPQPLRRGRLQVRRPVDAGQLHPPAVPVHDPSRARRQGEGRRGCCQARLKRI